MLDVKPYFTSQNCSHLLYPSPMAIRLKAVQLAKLPMISPDPDPGTQHIQYRGWLSDDLAYKNDQYAPQQLSSASDKHQRTWKQTHCGSFTVPPVYISSAHWYFAFLPLLQPCLAHLGTSKVKILRWLVYNNRLLSRDILASQGLTINTMCTFCSNYLETANHFFPLTVS